MPFQVAADLLRSGDLAKVFRALSRDGLFGERGRALAESGHVDRFCDRIGIAIANEKLLDLISIAATALGSKTPHVEFLRIARDPATRHKVLAAANEGLFGPQLQVMAESGSLAESMERLTSVIGTDAIRSVFARARALGADGSLLMVTQFAGDASPLGQAAQKMNSFVADGSLDWLEELVCSRVEGILDPNGTGPMRTPASVAADPAVGAVGDADPSPTADGIDRSPSAAAVVPVVAVSSEGNDPEGTPAAGGTAAVAAAEAHAAAASAVEVDGNTSIPTVDDTDASGSAGGVAPSGGGADEADGVPPVTSPDATTGADILFVPDIFGFD